VPPHRSRNASRECSPWPSNACSIS
jgi:hypothetical protein